MGTPDPKRVCTSHIDGVSSGVLNAQSKNGLGVVIPPNQIRFKITVQDQINVRSRSQSSARDRRLWH
jgi:hypothetical protein